MTGFGRSVVKIMQGTVGAQALGVLSLPIISRLYAPEAFGDFQAYQVCCGFLLVVVSLRYEIAILQAKDDREYSAVCGLSVFLCGLISLLVGVISVSLVCVPNLLSSSQTAIAVILPFGLFFSGLLQLLSYVQLRRESYSEISYCKLVQASGYFGLGVLFGFARLQKIGLSSADALSKFASVGAFLMMSKSKWADLRTWFCPYEFWSVAKKFWQLPLITATGGLINGACGAITVGFMYGTFGSFDSGQFGLVERSIGLPLAVVGNAISQVYMAKLSSSIRSDSSDLHASFRKLLAFSLGLAIVPSLLLLACGPFLFQFAFGSEWKLAGEFAQIMAPLFLTSFVYVPINMIFLVTGNQRIQFLWETSRLIALVIAWFIICNYGYASKSAIAIHVAINIFMHVIFIGLADRLTQKKSVIGRLAIG